VILLKKKYVDFPPALVVEILSPSTALKDRHSKFKIYEQEQVQYYLLVYPDKEEVEIYTLENGSYLLKHTGKDFTYTFFT
jgi:Uma2 family endonuclease